MSPPSKPARRHQRVSLVTALPTPSPAPDDAPGTVTPSLSQPGWAGRVRVGMSGWTHHSWRGNFYPAGLAARYELAYAAHRLNTVEITSTFSALQRPSSFHAWYEATPHHFQFSVLGPRYITHERGLRGISTALANFFASGVLALRDKLGPIVWQLPADQPLDTQLWQRFLANLPATTTEAAQLARQHDLRLRGRALASTDHHQGLRYAVHLPPHHPHLDALRRGCEQAGVAVVITELEQVEESARASAPHTTPASLLYLRLPGAGAVAPGAALPRPRLVPPGSELTSGYDHTALHQWAQWITNFAQENPLSEVVVVFTTDTNARAPFDAIALSDLLGLGQPQPVIPTSKPHLRVVTEQAGS